MLCNLCNLCTFTFYEHKTPGKREQNGNIGLELPFCVLLCTFHGKSAILPKVHSLRLKVHSYDTVTKWVLYRKGVIMRGRVYSVMQYLGRPYYDIEYDENGKAIKWKSDFLLNRDGTPKLDAEGRTQLKKTVKPLITVERVEEALDHRVIKQWAWVEHDKDVYTEEDEIDPETNKGGLIREGMAKFRHIHAMVHAPNTVDIERIADWFGVPVQYVQILRGRGAFEDGVEYLTHENEKQQAKGKTLYPDEAIHANFDWRKMLDERRELKEKFGTKVPRTDVEKLQMAVLVDGLSLKEAKERDRLAYAKCKNSLKSLRLDWLREQPAPPYRMTIFLDGKSGLGKTALARLLAARYSDDSYFETGLDERVTFEGYDGEQCILWNEVRAVELIKHFSRSGVLEMFDTHPGRQTQQIKGSSIMLMHSINIVNGIEPFEEFMDALAGDYTDKFGNEHKAEDKVQVYRRMPLMIKMTAEQVQFYLNKGYFDNDSREYLQYMGYQTVRSTFARAMRTLKDEALLTAARPLLLAADDGVNRIREVETDKISDPSEIPPELMAEVVPDYIPWDLQKYAEKNSETGRWYVPQNIIEEHFKCDGQTELELLIEEENARNAEREQNPFDAKPPAVAAINPRIMVEQMKNYAADDIIAVAEEIRAEREAKERK